MVILSSLPIHSPFLTAFSSSAWNSAVSSAGSIIRTLAGAGGAVGLAWCAVEYIISDSREADKALKKALIILLAAAAVMLLPEVLKLAKSFAAGNAWNPSNL